MPMYLTTDKSYLTTWYLILLYPLKNRDGCILWLYSTVCLPLPSGKYTGSRFLERLPLKICMVL